MSDCVITEVEKKQILLEVMDEIHDFCLSHDISYYLIGGSLLGAVRHNGFIPWDDDIDIGLPRKDYDYLLKNFKSKSGNVELLTNSNRKYYRWSHAKAIHNKTRLIELRYKKSEIGVFVDVFPLDYIDGDYEKAAKVVKRAKVWKDFLSIKYMRVSGKRSLLKNLMVIMGKVFFLVPDKFLIRKINSYGKQNCSGKEEYICNFSGAWGLKELARSEDFKSTIIGNFEGRGYLLPQGYDDYLRTVYGDYMILPPIEKRATHHSNTAYWK